jgi:hypothetical protein
MTITEFVKDNPTQLDSATVVCTCGERFTVTKQDDYPAESNGYTTPTESDPEWTRAAVEQFLATFSCPHVDPSVSFVQVMV